MSDKMQIGMDGTLVGWALVGATMTAVADHMIGLVDILAISVGILWLLDIVGGVLRAALQRRTLSWPKFLEGVGKMLIVAVVAMAFGLVELAQAQVFNGGYIPLAAPVLGGAMVLFVWSILDQAGDIWPAFGGHARRVLAEWEKRRNHGEQEDNNGD